jgi:hypothetical protein
VEYAPISDTYSEDSGQDSSSSSEDEIQGSRKETERQRRRALSPVENRYLDGLKRATDKPLSDAQGKQAMDKDLFSLPSPFKQAGSNPSEEDQQRRAGDVTGHGGSVSAHHGTPSLDLPAVAQLDGIQTAADLIRAGSSSSSSQPADPIRNNSDISLQVNEDKEVKSQAQLVLGEAFCITRLKEIRQLAGNLYLRNFTDGANRDHREKEIQHLFRRFLRQNGPDNPPFFCVSAAILGRLIHTFKEEHISQDLHRHASDELTRYVDEVLQQSKDSLAQDAAAIRDRTQRHIDRQNRLIETANYQATAAFEENHARMRDTMRAYSEALDQQLQTVLASTITEDTLNQEMEIAALAQRDPIREMTAVPPLLMDEDMLQLQTRCAILEQEAEDLRAQLQVHREYDAVGKLAILHKRMEGIQKELEEQTGAVDVLTQEKINLLRDKSTLQLRAAKVDTEVRRMKRAIQLDEKEAEVNQKVMRGLKERVDTAEGELERLKRKRKESVSPDRVVTGILKRSGTSPPSV